MPEYIASGSHYFQNERYRFLILHRYKKDLNSLVKKSRMESKCVIMLADQILNTLEKLHDRGYAHSDIKAGNLMVGDYFDIPENEANGKRVTVRARKNAKKVDNIVLASTPVKTCRTTNAVIAKEKSSYLRPSRNVVYKDHSDDEDYSVKKRGKKRKTEDRQFCFTIQTQNISENYKNISIKVDKTAFTQKEEPLFKEQKLYLIDFGLASKFMDTNGQHRPFCMDQRRAHDGTLEFTSRDAHMGAHSRRSDLEVLGYNLIYWSQGFLPWKDEKLLNQPEQVHRMKEYFMTDVKKMIPLIYGEECPAFLGEFLDYVNALTYDERPDYDHCRSIFREEFKKLGFDVEKDLKKLNVDEIKNLCHEISPECEEEITKKVTNVKQIIKLGTFYQYKESTLLMKSASPKNLRSKRDSKHKDTPSSKKKEKRFSWSDILCTDPDQIARERAEKEYDRTEHLEESVTKYKGHPTYAILEIENRLKNGNSQPSADDSLSDFHIEGYTKPMMDIVRKRQSRLFRDLQDCTNNSVAPNDETKNDDEEMDENEQSSDKCDSGNDDYVEEEEEEEEEEGEGGEEEEEEGEEDNVEESEPEVPLEKKLPQAKRKTRRGRRASKQIPVEDDSDFNEAEEDDEPDSSPISKRRTSRRKTRVTVRRRQNTSDSIGNESEQENVIPQNQRRVKRRGIDRRAATTVQSPSILQQASVIPKQPSSEQNFENNERKTRRRFIRKPTKNVRPDATTRKRKSAQNTSAFSASSSSHPATDNDSDYFVEDDDHKDEDFVHDQESCSSVHSNASSGSADTGTGSDDTYGRRYIQRKMVQTKGKRRAAAAAMSSYHEDPEEPEGSDEEEHVYSPVRVRGHKKVIVANRRGICLRKTHLLRNRGNY